MEQWYSWEADISSANQEFPPHFVVNKSRPYP